MGQSNTKETPSQPLTLSRTSTVESQLLSFKPKKYLSKVELVSLRCIFNDLKSTFQDHFECIEPKPFLEHLKLPTEVESAGVLLFKSLSYLGSYPLCTTAGPVPLSFDAFITAFVVLVGRLDTAETRLSEDLFFQSLSILPPPQEEQEEQVAVVAAEEEEEDDRPAERTTRGLSLAELGIDFNDVDQGDGKEEEEEVKGSDILCRDLIELFVFLLWLGQTESTPVHFKRIRQAAEQLVESMAPGKGAEDESPCISHALFCRWKNQFAPHLFKPLQSFIIKAFTYYGDANPGRLLKEDEMPEIESDILNPLHTTMLSWSLTSKTWTRLYSADHDGFSMNRFESHVFKYPGPTLLVMQVDTKEGQTMILGAYVAQPWKQSKQFWGDTHCFLFELSPLFDVFRPVVNEKGESKNNHYVFYHHDVGIGLGALDHQFPFSHQHDIRFILSLENSLQGGVYQHEAYTPQPSFESATRQRVDFSVSFETVNIEVFGLGTERDRERQAREWEFEKKEAARRSGLNIRQSDGQLDKELLKMAGIIDEDKRQDR